MTAPLLSCRNVGVAYDKVQVLFGVDLDVHEGEIVALLGTNGAGKSTLLKAVSGIARVNGGTITYAGTDITKAAAGNDGARHRSGPGWQGGVSHPDSGRALPRRLLVVRAAR